MEGGYMKIKKVLKTVDKIKLDMIQFKYKER